MGAFQPSAAPGEPVELIGVANLDHGAHNLQNPRQTLDVQNRTIEWFERWLNARNAQSHGQ